MFETGNHDSETPALKSTMPILHPPPPPYSYKRASLTLPLSPLLLLAAAALVALAVFFVNYYAPHASADHTADEEIWSATLTVQDIGSGSFGCLNDLSENAKKCSTGTTLTDYQTFVPPLSQVM